MNVEDRETVSVAPGYSLRMMASVLGRAPSTVSRELACTPRGDTPIGIVRHRHRHPRELVRHDVRANSWSPGCGSRCEPSWLRAGCPNREGAPEIRTVC